MMAQVEEIQALLISLVNLVTGLCRQLMDLHSCIGNIEAR